MGWYEKLIAKTATQIRESRAKQEARLKARGLDEADLGARFLWNLIFWAVIGGPTVYVLDEPSSGIAFVGLIAWLGVIVYRFSIAPYESQRVQTKMKG